MFFRFVAAVSMVFFVAAQMPSAYSQIPQPATAALAPSTQGAVPAGQSLTIPAGTTIPLTLINPIRSKTSKRGDAVRATVAFPVTVGSDVAIPAGSYAEGTIQSINARAGASAQPQAKIHFTRLLFANGYSAPLDAENTQAKLDVPDATAPETETAKITEPNTASVPVSAPQAHLVRASYAMEGQQQPTQPTLPPPPQVGPSPAVITGAVLGGGAALTIGMLLWGHHHIANLDYVLYDSGWQFQIVLEQPLTIDSSRIPAASTVSSSN
jgi:hypothetical protein